MILRLFLLLQIVLNLQCIADEKETLIIWLDKIEEVPIDSLINSKSIALALLIDYKKTPEDEIEFLIKSINFEKGINYIKKDIVNNTLKQLNLKSNVDSHNHLVRSYLNCKEKGAGEVEKMLNNIR